MNITKIFLMHLVCVFVACLTVQAAEKPLNSDAVAILKRYIQYLDASAQKADSDDALMADFDEAEAVRKKLLGFGEEGLRAMESVGLYYGNQYLRYDSRYAKYWQTYAFAAFVDAPGIGRPRLVEFCRRSDVSLQVKVWILRTFATDSQTISHWFPEDVLMKILDDLLKVKTTVARSRGVLPKSTVVREKAADGSEVVRNIYDPINFDVFLSGEYYAVEIISKWFNPGKMAWPSMPYMNSPEKAQDIKESIEYAHKWVASRRDIISLKESLFRLCEQHVVADAGAVREQQSLQLLTSLIEKNNTSDIGRFLKLYLNDVGSADSTSAYREMLGKAIADLLSKGGIKCTPPTSEQLSSPDKAKNWILSLAQAGEEAAGPWHTAREWSLLRQELSVLQSPASNGKP